MTRKQLTSKTAIKTALMAAIKKGEKKEFFRLYFIATGIRENDRVFQMFRVLGFCRQYLSEHSALKAERIIRFTSPEEVRRHEWSPVYHSEKHNIIMALKKFMADPTSNYAKQPMYGYTHLYFCSPVYGHADYNKWRALPIEGNERFCELVVKLGERYSHKA